MRLDGRKREQLERDGFVAIQGLIDESAVSDLRAAYDEMLSAHIETDRYLGGITRQIMVPSMSHSTFTDNPALRAGKELVAHLFSTPHAARTYDMLIFKPPGHPHETPWHQDAGYFVRPIAPAGTPIRVRSLQFWLALDDVDEENGCMHFVPGRHREGVLEHRVIAGDPQDEGRLVGLTAPERQLDLDAAVACPLRAGGCTIHTAGTPHFTPPNRSTNRPRRAYIFNIDPAESGVHPLESDLREAYVAEVAATRARSSR